MSFERLTYIDRLKQAGVEEGVARAHADALRTALGETVATRDDIAGTRPAIRQSIAGSATATKADLDPTVMRFDQSSHNVDQRVRRFTIHLCVALGYMIVVVLASMILFQLFD